jgi:hypothetical protein
MTPMSIVRVIRSLAAVSAIAAAIVSAPAPAGAQAAFNGTWSVLIVTTMGSCDRAYRYPLRVDNGRVTYGGQADFKVSGRVSSNGAVTVTVSRGDQGATGSGRLVGRSGSGTWRGAASSNACSGTWTAEKRG